MARDACPPLVAILFLLAQNWVICRRRYERFEKRRERAGALAEPEDDEEGRTVWDAYQDHPFPGFVRWVSRHTGEEQDSLRAAAIKEFNGEPAIVEKLNALDDRGVTAELFEKLRGECPDIVQRLFAARYEITATGAGPSPLADLLDRAGEVFGMVWTLGREFEKDHKSQGPVIMACEPSPRQGHGGKIKEFIAAVLDSKGVIENPPDGAAAVIEQLREAGRLAKRLSTANEGDILELWPDLNQVAHDGCEAVKSARKTARLDDPFAFLDDLPKPVITEPAATDGKVKRDAATPRQKRSTERGEGRAKLIAALTKHHKYADGGCLNLEPIGNNELARMAKVAKRTASAFFNKEFQGHTKYKALCIDPPRLVAALKALNGEFRPHEFYDARTPDDLEQEGE